MGASVPDEPRNLLPRSRGLDSDDNPLEKRADISKEPLTAAVVDIIHRRDELAQVTELREVAGHVEEVASFVARYDN